MNSLYTYNICTLKKDFLRKVCVFMYFKSNLFLQNFKRIWKVYSKLLCDLTQFAVLFLRDKRVQSFLFMKLEQLERIYERMFI